MTFFSRSLLHVALVPLGLTLAACSGASLEPPTNDVGTDAAASLPGSDAGVGAIPDGTLPDGNVIDGALTSNDANADVASDAGTEGPEISVSSPKPFPRSRRVTRSPSWPS